MTKPRPSVKPELSQSPQGKHEHFFCLFQSAPTKGRIVMEKAYKPKRISKSRKKLRNLLILFYRPQITILLSKAKEKKNMAALLEAKNVTKIYAKSQHPSLNKVSFSVTDGEFIAIMGASGSGKTTLLNVLSTIDTPTSGSITINGVNLKNLTDSKAADFRRIIWGLFSRNICC